jgi:RNA polymerase sigma-70 factor, ECF subfamily
MDMGARPEELEQLYRERFVAFRNGLLPLTGGLEAARDAVQEGFARALRDREQFRGDGPLEGWVWRITFRAALAARSNHHPLSLDEAILDMPLPTGERDRRLAEALRALPPRRRLIVFLRYFADLSYAEIAELCEVSEGTVGAALAKAHADLSRSLGNGESHG